jgi:hypothetical protein
LIDDRTGTRLDAKRLSQLFTKLKFDVILKKDLTATDINHLLDNISKRDELVQHHALVVIILSHGHQRGAILGKDFRVSSRGYIRDKEVFKKFNDLNCPQLRGKPKIFIFNACRGGNYKF